jgi:hypothetical protein
MLDDSSKLFPLRKISNLGIISNTYLSILAKKGKLRTRKIGRNYFTTIEWFNEYLVRHAKDEVIEKFKNINLCTFEVVSTGKSFLESKDESADKIKLVKKIPQPSIGHQTVGFLFAKNIYRYSRQFAKISSILVVATIVFAFGLMNIFGDANKTQINSGRIAGIEEKATSTPSNDPFNDRYLIYDNTVYRISDSVSSRDGEIMNMEKLK